MTRLLRWWRTRPWRGYRPDRVDRLDAAEFVRRAWPDLSADRVIGLVLVAVGTDGPPRGALFTLMPSASKQVWQAAGLAALLQAQGDEAEDMPKGVN